MKKHFHNQTPVYEENYKKFLRLVSQLQQVQAGEYLHQKISPQLEVIIEILQQGPYTTQLKLSFTPTALQPWPIAYSFVCRVCHDAQVAEVLHYQHVQRFAPDYLYPNSLMFHRDEKRQSNLHLADTLDLCLAQKKYLSSSSGVDV